MAEPEDFSPDDDNEQEPFEEAVVNDGAQFLVPLNGIGTVVTFPGVEAADSDAEIYNIQFNMDIGTLILILSEEDADLLYNTASRLQEKIRAKKAKKEEPKAPDGEEGEIAQW